ncbi:MAG: hypothetical protein AABX98_03525 [Nanoarchaeota archaeon]
MKTKHIIQYSFLFLVVIILSSVVFAIQGTSSDGSVTAKNGGASAAAASGTSSDNTVTGRVSAGGSGVASSYSGDGVSGNSGPDLSTSDASTPVKEETKEAEETSSTIPSGGGGGGGGSGGADGSAGESSDAEATTEATTEATQTTEQAAEAADATSEESVSVAVELSEGSSLTLSPETGAASMTVTAVTETSATIVIESAQTTEEGNSITGAVVIGVEQETTLSVGETVEVDSDGDGEIDLEITLTKIVYDEETGKYRGIFTTTYLYPNEETITFIEEQISSGQVTLVERPSMERMAFEYWIWLIVAVLVIAVVGFILWVLKDKKTKRYVPTTIPTHYFEKILRSELRQDSGQKEQPKKQEIQKEENNNKQEEKKEVVEEKKAAVQKKGSKKRAKKRKKTKGKNRKKKIAKKKVKRQRKDRE